MAPGRKKNPSSTADETEEKKKEEDEDQGNAEDDPQTPPETPNRGDSQQQQHHLFRSGIEELLEEARTGECQEPDFENELAVRITPTHHQLSPAPVWNSRLEFRGCEKFFWLQVKVQGKKEGVFRTTTKTLGSALLDVSRLLPNQSYDLWLDIYDTVPEAQTSAKSPVGVFFFSSLGDLLQHSGCCCCSSFTINHSFLCFFLFYRHPHPFL